MRSLTIFTLILSACMPLSSVGATENPADPCRPVPAGDPCRIEPAVADPCGLPPALQLSQNPNQQKPLPDIELGQTDNAPTSPAAYWKTTLHPQVTPAVFDLISYPYQPGTSYNRENTPPLPEFIAASFTATVADPCDPCQTPQSTFERDPADEEHIRQLWTNMQLYQELLFTWRQANEAPATALEIVRAAELTRLDTDIYKYHPDLAVAVRRTLGQISHTNRLFTRTHHDILLSLLHYRLPDSAISRLEKLYADLTALLEKLAQQNDDIATALGVGAIDRTSPWIKHAEKIDYSYLTHP